MAEASDLPTAADTSSGRYVASAIPWGDRWEAVLTHMDNDGLTEVDWRSESSYPTADVAVWAASVVMADRLRTALTEE